MALFQPSGFQQNLGQTPGSGAPGSATVVVSAVEGADVASFTVAWRQSVTLGATESPDIAAFAIAGRQRVALGAVESPDVAAFSIGARVRVALGAIESPDVAAFSVTALAGISTVSLSAQEGADVAFFSLRGPQVQENTPGFLTPEEYKRLRKRAEKREEKQQTEETAIVEAVKTAPQPKPAKPAASQLAEAEHAISAVLQTTERLTPSILDLVASELERQEIARQLALEEQDEEALLLILALAD